MAPQYVCKILCFLHEGFDTVVFVRFLFYVLNTKKKEKYMKRLITPNKRVRQKIYLFKSKFTKKLI